MKKMLKKLALLTLALAVCVSFSSCFSLDDIRDTRAVYVDSTHEKIEFRGNTYKKIPSDFSDYLNTYSLPDYANVVEKDVPLLLTEIYGVIVDFDENDTRLLFVDYDTYYCREDVYDYAVETLEKNEFDYYCAEIYDYDAEEYKIVDVDKSLVDIVDEIIYTTEPSSEYPYAYESVSIYATDEEKMFRHGAFYIELTEKDRYFISMDNLAEDIAGYLVPSKYNKHFDFLFPDSEEAEDYYSDEIFF